MNKIVSYIGGMFLVALSSSATAVLVVPTGNFADGKLLVEGVCAACHGTDGNSAIATNPRLAGQNAKYTFKQLQDFKSGARPSAVMASQAANLTEQDMANVALYFSKQRGKVSLSNPDIKQGQKLFLGGDGKRGVVPCAGCHGPAGKGNQYAAFPKVGGQHADYIKQQLKAFRAAGRDDITMDNKRNNDSAKKGEKGMMQMVASKLSDQDIVDLANYMTGLN